MPDLPDPAAAEPDPADLDLVTIADVELCRVGTWAASTGPFTATVDKFDAIVAAQHDPDVDDGIIRLGHTGGLADLGDSAPSLGRVRNLRREGDRLLGDFVGVPAPLAAIIPTAYARRSVELLEAVRTAAGRTYKAVLTGVALLGVTPGAVTGLADIVDICTGKRGFAPVAARRAPTGTPVAVTTGPTPGPAADQAAAVVAAAGRALAEIAAAAEPSATVTPPPGHTVPDARHPHLPGGPPVAPMTDERLRELLGAEADADVEALLAEARAALEATPPAAAPPAGPVVSAPAAVPAVGGPPAPAPSDLPVPVAAAAGLPAGLVAVDEAVLAELAAGAEAGRVALAAQAGQTRDAALEAHTRAGRIAPASVDHWRTQWDRDPEGTAALLSALPAAYHTVEVGAADVAASGADEDARYADFMATIPGLAGDFAPTAATPAGGPAQ